MLIWLGALAIGLSLGLLGAGGSLLTVPVLIYLVGQPEKIAIAGSLGIVGTISVFGAIPYVRRRRVAWTSVLLFGLPSMVGTYAGAYLAQFVSGRLQLAVFAFLTGSASVLMLRPIRPPDTSRPPHAYWKIALEGLGVGVMTGFVGVGGGFLIVPALVLLGGLSMRVAVGTSLVIITLKSYSGFSKYLDVLDALHLRLDWHVIGLFSVVGIAGSLAGSLVSTRLPQRTLRRAFAALLLGVSLFIVWQLFSQAAAP